VAAHLIVCEAGAGAAVREHGPRRRHGPVQQVSGCCVVDVSRQVAVGAGVVPDVVEPSPRRHCHSYTVIDCQSLWIYALILLPLLSFSATMTDSPTLVEPVGILGRVRPVDGGDVAAAEHRLRVALQRVERHCEHGHCQ
jgi:hypothetical protein